MKIKHWQGYGSLTATKIKDPNCTLHIRVTGNHECGLYRNDEYDIFNWLVKKFDKSVIQYSEFHKKVSQIVITENTIDGIDTCDYCLTY